MLTVGGAILLLFGCAETVWALRSPDLPRHMVAQGAFFLELGLAFLAMGLLEESVMRTSLATAFALSAFVSAVMQYRMMRAAKRVDS